MKNVIELEEVTSTNDYLKENYEHLNNNTIVFSHMQTKGRGRLNHVWESEVGNLYFSILRKNDIDYKSLFKELKIVSIGIVELLNKYNINAMIKYPNDIVVGNKKIAGILIESLGNRNLEYIVIGIGLNINQIDFGSLDGKATSIKLETNKNHVVKEVLAELLDIFKLSNSSINRYLELSMVIGKEIEFENVIYNIEKIDVLGNLVLKNKENEVRIQMNEVSLGKMYK